jgi:hypothetical protein
MAYDNVKWANCPAGDYNHAKEKKRYPTLGITDYNCQIISYYGPQFGTRNGKDIVKTDVNGKAIVQNKFSFPRVGLSQHMKILLK